MPETAKLLEPGFSVADAEYPTFALREGTFSLDFVDWRERKIHVRFSNAAGVMWQELESMGPEERGDEVYEILESSWVAAYNKNGARTPGDALRHFRLCFNAYGVLDVLASSMDMDAG